jgi:hypothetical protein
LMGKAVMGGWVRDVCKVSGGRWGGGEGMWSRHTFSLIRLEPTRMGIESPGGKDGQCGRGEEARPRRLKEWRDGKKRMR